MDYLVNKFWPNETQRQEIKEYYLTRTVQVSGICNRRKTMRYHIQCAFTADCSNPPNDCYRPPINCYPPPPAASGCCECTRPPKCTWPPATNNYHCQPTNSCCPKQTSQCRPPIGGCNHPHAGWSGPPKWEGKPAAHMQTNYSYHDFDPKDWDLIIDKSASLYVHFSYE